MQRKRKLLIAKTAVVMGTIPLLIWAHASGPDVGKSGVPNESTCAESGCHTGTPLNGGGGNVSVAFPNGATYTPGVKQHLVVTITDSAQRIWGFQLSARLASNTKTMAGTFTSTDQFTAVVCGASPTDMFGEQFLDFGQPQTCPAAKPYTYIEHTKPGSQRLQPGSQTFEFDWTPPAAASGNINIYVAGNAANGDTENTGDHIYTASYTLAMASGTPPSISSDGVQNGASFVSGLTPNSWITIKGSNLSSATDTWDKAIVNGKLPTTLDGVSVDVGGKPAYLYYVSPGQINAIAPDVGTGSMTVTVANSGGSNSATANSTSVGPAFFSWPGQQPVATRADNTWAVKNGAFAGTTTVPAKPGETIILWGTGFGPTSPAAPVGVATPTDKLYNSASPVTATINGAPATVQYALLAPTLAAVYQIAITVPANAPDGDLPIVVTVAGVQSPAGVLLTVKH